MAEDIRVGPLSWTVRVWAVTYWTVTEWHWEATQGGVVLGNGKTGYRWTAVRAAKKFCRNPNPKPKKDRYHFSFSYRPRTNQTGPG